MHVAKHVEKNMMLSVIILINIAYSIFLLPNLYCIIYLPCKNTYITQKAGLRWQYQSDNVKTYKRRRKKKEVVKKEVNNKIKSK